MQDREYDDYVVQGKEIVKTKAWERTFKFDQLMAAKKPVYQDRRYYVHAQWLKLKDELQLAPYFVI